MTDFDLAGCSEKNLATFFNKLETDDDEICINFQRKPFLIPAASLGLLIKINEWHQNNKKVFVRNHQKYTYLQTIDFFKQCNVEIEEDFVRSNTQRSYVPITKIKYEVDELAENIATCLVPEQSEFDNPEKSGIFDCVCYSVTELANNARQHSKGTGFCLAQRYPNSGNVRLSIGDTGIGIKESLIDSPYCKDSDVAAIEEALKVNVSGRAYKFVSDSPNAGVGLSLLTEVTRRAKGSFAIISGTGYVDENGSRTLSCGIKGTLCNFSFPISFLEDKSFNQSVLWDAKKALGLIGDTEYGGMFI
jgi:hypothetical protein